MTKVILDHTQDISGTETYRLTSLHEPPDFVKEAQHDRLHGDPEVLPANVYGDAATRTWPVHSKAATWMSSLFFFDKKSQLDPKRAEAAERRIMESARFFNILPQVEELKTKIANSVKHSLSAVPDEDFALVWETEHGKDRHYPLRNEREVKIAEEWFTKFRDEFLWADRQKMAAKIHEKAAQYRVSLDDPELIEKTAGYGYCASAEIAEMLEQRGNMCARSHQDLSDEMLKFAEVVRSNTIDVRDQSTREKIAAVVDQYDRETKLNRLYDAGGLERPEEVLFKLTTKHAEDFLEQHVQMPSGNIYEKSSFANLSVDHVRNWLGDDFSEAVSAGGLFVDPEKIAAIAPTLPRGDADAFDAMARAAGVQPYATGPGKQASADVGLTQDEIYRLAAQYGNEYGLSGDASVL